MRTQNLAVATHLELQGRLPMITIQTVIKAYLKCLGEALLRGERVQLRHVGVFRPYLRPTNNVFPGSPGATVVIHFRASEPFREKLRTEVFNVDDQTRLRAKAGLTLEGEESCVWQPTMSRLRIPTGGVPACVSTVRVSSVREHEEVLNQNPRLRVIYEFLQKNGPSRYTEISIGCGYRNSGSIGALLRKLVIRGVIERVIIGRRVHYVVATHGETEQGDTTGLREEA